MAAPDIKGINLHKRNAMGERITGMKRGGATRGKADCPPGMMKRGGKTKKKGK